MLRLLFIVGCFIVVIDTVAQDIPVKSYWTDRLQSPVTIDGKGTEKAWDQVDWGSDFIQHSPAQ